MHQRRLDVDAPWGRVPVWVGYPRRADQREHPPGRRYPVLIALHGRGESRDPARGWLGWANLYELPAAFGALARGSLAASDYRGLVRDAHLRAVNASLRARPFGGVLVVAPALPDVMGADAARRPLVDSWLAGPLLAAVRERFAGAAHGAASTGIDGVSMGGAIALDTGLAHPNVFGSVGAIQPAIRGREAELAELAALAAESGHPQAISLLTSDGDPFLGPTRRLSELLRERAVPHSLAVLPGPHDYVFNRGPAGLEMLLFHDRALVPEAVDAP